MKAGDHIVIRAPGTTVHAIDLGDRTAIHFVPGVGPRRSLLQALSGGAPVEVVTYAVRAYSPKQTVARAFSRFAEGAYASMFDDGEAFAAWCRTGQLPLPAAPAGASPPADAPATGEARTGAAPATAPVARTRRSPRVKPRSRAKARTAPAKRAPAKRRPAARTKSPARAGKSAVRSKRGPGAGGRKPAGRGRAASRPTRGVAPTRRRKALGPGRSGGKRAGVRKAAGSPRRAARRRS